MGTALLEQVVNGLLMGSIYVLVALGMMLIYGVMHVLNFAHGALLMLGAYVCQLIFTQIVGSYAFATLGAIIALLPIGWALERGVFGPLRDNLRSQVIASLGLVIVLQNLAVIIWGPSALQLKLDLASTSVPLGGLSVSAQQLLVIALTFACVTGLFAFLRFTKFGTAVRATAQNARAAQVIGIDVDRVHLITFGISIGLAALAGSLIGPLFLVFPQMGDLPLVKGLAGILLGGMGSIGGAVVGGLTIGIVEAVSTLVIPSDYRDVVTFLIIAAVLLLRPQGLFGVRTRYED